MSTTGVEPSGVDVPMFTHGSVELVGSTWLHSVTYARDGPTPAEYRRKVAMRESALLEAKEFVLALRVGQQAGR